MRDLVEVAPDIALPRWRVACRVGLDFVLPPRCLRCGTRIGHQGELCATCWAALVFIGDPLCHGCGRPLPHDLPGTPLCAPCSVSPPTFDRMRSALVYDDASRALIIGFKHGGRIEGTALFARWLARAGGLLLVDATLVAPVPLHRWRLLRRGFNQSALLANGIAALAGTRSVPDLLVRRRATASQQGLTASARAENITAAAFAAHPRWVGAIRGARIVLVDDVYTTGATAAACIAVLRRAGAARVDVLTLARVVRDEAIPI